MTKQELKEKTSKVAELVQQFAQAHGIKALIMGFNLDGQEMYVYGAGKEESSVMLLLANLNESVVKNLNPKLHAEIEAEIKRRIGKRSEEDMSDIDRMMLMGDLVKTGTFH